MIHDLDATIKAMLTEELNRFDEYRTGAIQYAISFDLPNKDWEKTLNKLTVNFYLYDVRENHELRSNEQNLTRNANNSISRSRRPLRVDCYYLVTTWSNANPPTVSYEHMFLGHVLWALARNSLIAPKWFQGYLNQLEPMPELPTKIAQVDNFKSLGELWSALENELKPGINYVVTIPIDMEQTFTSQMVLVKIAEYGSLTSTFRFAIRPAPRQATAVSPREHLRGTPLIKMAVDDQISKSLADAADKGADKIRLDNVGQLAEDNVLMIVDGVNTEFCQIKAFLQNNNISIYQALLFKHENGAELKRLTPAAESLRLSLAEPLMTGASHISTSGANAKEVRTGDLFKLDNPNKFGANEFEYVQITALAGRSVGLSASVDTFLQVGGIVTNQAKAPVLGAEVMLLDAANKAVAETRSDVEGKFSFGNLQKGKYTFKISATGYKLKQNTVNDIATAKLDDFFFELESQT
ncbi:DUF4255 domain-containing protein [candidate division KSB1 bacterium]|nr:DUF4255 domain-containing protein [candidate division KSB1 bacterium]